jgi:cytochrome c
LNIKNSSMIAAAAILIAGQAAYAQPAAPPVGDPVRGQTVYKQKCSSCHTGGTFTGDFTGPQLDGVVGRSAGGTQDFDYSTALKTWGMVWTPALIDQFLAGPSKLVPGTMMNVTVSSEQDRADVIAFLATLK